MLVERTRDETDVCFFKQSHNYQILIKFGKITTFLTVY